jgi:hypothetical protein
MMPQPKLPMTGGCNCGAVRFEVSEPLVGAVYCHCKRCQRRSGTGHTISGRAAPGSFRIVAGEGQVRSWNPGDGGWPKSFCEVCGSHLFVASPDDPDTVSVRFGAFDEDPGARGEKHQFTAYAPVWDPVPDDGLPRFREGAG